MTTQPNGHRILYISHGAGPLPILGDERHFEMVDNLKLLATRMPKPSAIIVVSAHWEETVPTVLTNPAPPLLYDYYGFPEESYELTYPAKGHPELAQDILDKLQAQGIPGRANADRGFDHGMFIPLKIMYPEADIPTVQVSLVKGLDPAAHLQLGQALAQVEHENLLILGSGFSFHNMRAFFDPETAETRRMNTEFEQWLIETCSSPDLTDEERANRFLDWESAPHARYCHPREEHLMPVLTCCGAAQGPCTEFYELEIFGKKGSTYLW